MGYKPSFNSPWFREDLAVQEELEAQENKIQEQKFSINGILRHIRDTPNSDPSLLILVLTKHARS
jgi:hypothetical protein